MLLQHFEEKLSYHAATARFESSSESLEIRYGVATQKNASLHIIVCAGSRLFDNSSNIKGYCTDFSTDKLQVVL